jgi:hypothetical protein
MPFLISAETVAERHSKYLAGTRRRWMDEQNL